jgi:hypothetical protein
MKPGDLVRVHLYGRWHDELALVIKVKRFKGGVIKSSCQIFWCGSTKWIIGENLKAVDEVLQVISEGG